MAKTKITVGGIGAGAVTSDDLAGSVAIITKVSE